MLACPILEDELVHNILTDYDEKNVFVLINDNTKTLLPKLNEAGIKHTMMSESSFLQGHESLPEDGFNIVIWMMDLGLHEEPEELKNEIHRLLKTIDEHVEVVMMYYGICGKAFNDIEEWSKDNMNTPVTIFKDSEGRICDDCICVPLGGTDTYLKLLKKHTGVLYFTPAMACSFNQFRDSMEIFRGMPEEDTDMFKMILDMAGYKQALTIQTGLGDQKNFFAEAKKSADDLGLELIHLEEGWASTEVADRTYSEAKGFLS